MLDIDIHIFCFPVSLLLGAAFLLSDYLLYKTAGGNKFVRWLTSMPAAVVALSVVCVAVFVEGVFACGLVRHPVFFALDLIFLFILGLSVMRGFAERRRAGYLLCHGGLFVIVFAATFGAPDRERMTLPLSEGDQPTNVAYNADGTLHPLPIAVQLQRFTIEYYPGTQSPKQYRSALLVDDKEVEVAVNSPARCGAYTLFQQSFTPDYSVLEVSRDPWLPVVYLGFALLAAGCLWLLTGRAGLRASVPVALVVAVAFTALSVARINFTQLMPALRSLWFVPHLIIYMVAYAVVAIALVMALVRRQRCAVATDRMMRAASALIAIGMLSGAVWARQAWGDYWTWDPKENLAAVTWLLTLLYIHTPARRLTLRALIILLTFVALQLTWYGVNYLPSAHTSLHTYTS